MDEFRSLKNQVGPFSFPCMDGDTGELLDILPTRNKGALEDKDRRDGHECFLCPSDKGMFSKGNTLADRFHIVKHLIRNSEDIRIRIMKSFDRNDST
ncbi:hypothetical protein ACJX4K_000047 [Enterococcus faecalis]|uniref:transposase n=2 Tax=Enterococcus TaxID=1350 RepID=UPI00094E5577|nr:transposase [Enterococcus faecalis]MDN3177287.1 transposase [Enterococcus faecalis]RBR68411.1 hypothetical protein EB41_00757 [Enterococcus faecalis]